MRALHFDSALTPDGWRSDAVVVVDDAGLIAEVRDAPRDGVPVERIAGAALPGLANVHSHAFQRGMAGLAEHAGDSEDSFWTWREAMYLFLDAVEPEDAEAIAAMAYVEMLEGGFTVVGEFHYLHHDPAGQPYADPAEMAVRHVAAAFDTGIGMTLLPVFYAHGNFGGAPPANGQRRFLNGLGGFARLFEASTRAIRALPHARLGIAPHSLRAVALPELAALLAAYPEGPVHIHVSEQVREVEDCFAAHGCRPVELLFDNAEVDARWCLIHATHADEGERRRIAASGAVVGLCPVTEANLGDGIFPALDYRGQGGAFAVGTDSNVAISVPGELRMLEYSQRLAIRRRNALAPRNGSTARTLHDAALAGGAQALGLGSVGIAPGARADFVVLDTNHVAFASRDGDRLLDAFVFTSGARAVREVWSAGRRVVEGGPHHARERVEARFRKAIARVIGR